MLFDGLDSGSRRVFAKRSFKPIALFVAMALLSAVGMAQWSRDPGGRPGGFGGGESRDRAGVPNWERNAEIPYDTFTFARVQYGGSRRSFGGWRVDYPNADLNFAYRLEQLTAIKTCLLYTSPSPRDRTRSRMPSSA